MTTRVKKRLFRMYTYIQKRTIWTGSRQRMGFNLWQNRCIEWQLYLPLPKWATQCGTSHWLSLEYLSAFFRIHHTRYSLPPGALSEVGFYKAESENNPLLGNFARTPSEGSSFVISILTWATVVWKGDFHCWLEVEQIENSGQWQPSNYVPISSFFLPHAFEQS